MKFVYIMYDCLTLSCADITRILGMTIEMVRKVVIGLQSDQAMPAQKNCVHLQNLRQPSIVIDVKQMAFRIVLRIAVIQSLTLNRRRR